MFFESHAYEREDPQLARLAEELQATFKYSLKYGGQETPGYSSNPMKREVRLTEPHTGTPRQEEDRYWSALHELGHVAHEHIGTGLLYAVGDGDSVPEQEAEAWSWALDHTDRPLTALARASMVTSLASYLYSFGVPAVIGPNLRRMASVIGPSANVDLISEIDPVHAQLVAATWESNYTLLTNENDLANAA